MRNLLKSTMIIGLSIVSFSTVTAQSYSKVVGNGNITTKTINTQEYDVIKAVGPMDVHLEKGVEGKITVTAENNLHEYIIVEVKDGNVLEVRIKQNTSIKTNKKIIITIPVKDISGISLVGSGDLDSKDTIEANALDISLTGSGDLNLDIKAAELAAKITGSGDMKITGSATIVEVKLSGSGDYTGSSLIAETTEAYVSGSGDAEVNASSSIKARVNGSGSIRYTGNPAKSDAKVSGSGSIKSM